MMKMNALYPWIVTDIKCNCAYQKQKMFLEFSQAKKTSTYSMQNHLSFIPSQTFLWF